MPTCRKCKQRITRLDKDICPFCGTIKPLEGVSSETLDITKAFNPIDKDFVLYRSKSRITAGWLCGLFGFLGIHCFYMLKPKQGLFFILLTFLLVGGLGTIFFFTLLPMSAWAFLIPFSVEEAIMVALAFVYRYRDDLKDGRGELLH